MGMVVRRTGRDLNRRRDMFLFQCRVWHPLSKLQGEGKMLGLSRAWLGGTEERREQKVETLGRLACSELATHFGPPGTTRQPGEELESLAYAKKDQPTA